MGLVSSNQMLLAAQAGGYAVGAFNVENMEMIKAVIQAAEEAKSPVILQTTPSTVTYEGLATCVAMVTAEARKVSVPVCLHLDHGSSFELAMQAIREGYTSIMIDGSGETLEDNIVLTRKVVEAARPNGLTVEAELGKVGGKEDGLEAEADTNTDPAQAAEFVKRTGVDSLAVAIGTAHGFYSGTPILDKERLTQIREVVSVPLVLHGASGLSNDEVRDCVARGICKVNFATELRAAYTEAMKTLMAKNPETFDPKKFGIAGMEAVTALVKNRMAVCGCWNKA